MSTERGDSMNTPFAKAAYAAIAVCLLTAPCIAQTTARVSVSSTGEQAGGFSSAPSISADGRFIAFQSDASNLVPGDTNGVTDIFVRDNLADTTTRVSVSTTGDEGNDQSIAPAISADGRFVAFASYASNLVRGDSNFAFDVFIHDRQTASTTRVSVDDAGGQGEGNSGNVGLGVSADGRFVVFESDAADLVLGDSNAHPDVFVHDRLNAQTSMISIGAGGQPADDYSALPVVSADGRFVVFYSAAMNLDPANPRRGIYMRDMQVGATSWLFNSSQPTSISSDARYVAVTNGPLAVVFDTQSGGTTPFGGGWTCPPECNGGSPSLSGDGRFLAFWSDKIDFVPDDSNGRADIFIVDRDSDDNGFLDESGTITYARANINYTGDQANAASTAVALSADGRWAAFQSVASNLIDGDTNGQQDIFVRDLRPCARGGVNAGAGQVTGVLRVNGRAGGVVFVNVGGIVEFALDAAPMGPSPARYLVWVWPTFPSNQQPLRARSQDLGCTTNPTPLLRGAIPQPGFCILGAGLPVAACGLSHRVPAPSPDAPWVFRRSQGFATRMTLTLQGVLEDNGAANSTGFSVTNAVVLFVQ